MWISGKVVFHLRGSLIALESGAAGSVAPDIEHDKLPASDLRG
jgi:hypothetical protein